MSADTGHTLGVTIKGIGGGWAEVDLTVQCHEPDGAACRVTCPKDCDEWDLVGHEHGLVAIEFCNAVEWITAGELTVAEQYDGPAPAPLHDGMPIEVRWTGVGYVWELTGGGGAA